MYAPRVRQTALPTGPLTAGLGPASECRRRLGGGDDQAPARSAEFGSACNPSANAGLASRREASAGPPQHSADLRVASPSKAAAVSHTPVVPPSTGSELAKDGSYPRYSSLGAPNTLTPRMGSGRTEAMPPVGGPSLGASFSPDVESSWAIEIGSRYSSLSRELARAGIPTLMLDHFTSQKGIAGPALRLDFRSTRGWAPAYELLASGGLAYVHFEPHRGTLAPQRKPGRVRRQRSRERE